MRLLLDTHTLLWAGLDDPQLSARARSILLDQRNTLYLSAASSWEIVIKYQLGKLRLPDSPERFLQQCLQLLVVENMSITLEHTLLVESLPAHHRDPFDRILIAQANAENLTILTNDRAFAQYPVATFW